MNTSTEHILQCNQSEPLADASESIVDMMNENEEQRMVRKHVIFLIHQSMKNIFQSSKLSFVNK